jgi:HEAT repeat protein
MATPDLQRLLADEDVDVCAQAVKALLLIEPTNKRGINELIRRLSAKDENTRFSAAVALGNVSKLPRSIVPRFLGIDVRRSSSVA